MIAVLAAVVIGLVAWILVLYNQAPGGVNFPTINWPGGTESEELRSCGGSLQCPEGYECVYEDDEDVIDRAGECKKR